MSWIVAITIWILYLLIAILVYYILMNNSMLVPTPDLGAPFTLEARAGVARVLREHRAVGGRLKR